MRSFLILLFLMSILTSNDFNVNSSAHTDIKLNAHSVH